MKKLKTLVQKETIKPFKASKGIDSSFFKSVPTFNNLHGLHNHVYKRIEFYRVKVIVLISWCNISTTA